METNNTYNEKKIEKQKKRIAERAQLDKSKFIKKTIRWIVWLAILSVIFYFVFSGSKKADPQGEDLSQSFPIMGRQHLEIGEEHPAYNSNPPSSGWHYEQTSKVGFYENDEIVLDENVIHNLEHGDIWIAYRSDVSEILKNELKKFSGNYVIIAPRSANEKEIALVAWGRVDSFDATFSEKGEFLEEERIRDFIKRYDNKGPEKVR